MSTKQRQTVRETSGRLQCKQMNCTEAMNLYTVNVAGYTCMRIIM